jgi:hypothetical protein
MYEENIRAVTKGSANISATRGSVLHDPSVYLIYYGNTPEKKKNIVDTFVGNLGRSDWWKINTLYGDSRGFVSPSLKLKGSTVINPGSNMPLFLNTSTDLTEATSIVQGVFDAGSVIPDTEGNTSESA